MASKTQATAYCPDLDIDTEDQFAGTMPEGCVETLHVLPVMSALNKLSIPTPFFDNLLMTSIPLLPIIYWQQKITNYLTLHASSGHRMHTVVAIVILLIHDDSTSVS